LLPDIRYKLLPPFSATAKNLLLLAKIGEEIFTLTNKDDLAFALQLAKHLKTEEISKIAICKIDRWEEDKYYTTTEEYIELKEI
jgi:hypothetical protein